MNWGSFHYADKAYDLSHLDPRQVTYIQPRQGDKDEVRYETDVTFSMHCFTRGLKLGENPEKALLFSDVKETRVFDFGRYSLSLHLPEIINGLLERKCFHTGKGNFFTIRVLDNNGETVEYEVFFKAYKPAKRGRISLVVESAYVRDKLHSTRPKSKPVGFHVILYNTLNNKPIKMAK